MVEISQKWAACIVYFNDAPALAALLEDLKLQDSQPEKIFICDNNSTTTFESELNNNIHVIKLAENKGFGTAANEAIGTAIAAGFENLILFSQDVRLQDSKATSQLVSEVEKNNLIAYPTMLNRRENNVFSKGGSINFLTGKIYLNTKSNSRKKFWADGSCLAFNQHLFKSLNGFDQNYFMYFEDVDFCYRAVKNSYQLKHVPVEVSQNPNGPSSLLRSRNSVRFAKKVNKWFLLAVIKRNLFGSLKSFLTLDIASGKDRYRGIRLGLKADARN
jgi:GT2 family glycosyltransferase